jgi:hypothetical protein
MNMLALREGSLSVTPPVPFWNFFNTMPYGGQSQFDISEGEIRWQVSGTPHIALSSFACVSGVHVSLVTY